MIDIDRKINKIEKSCLEMARQETKILEEENNAIINEKKAKLVNNYKDELAEKYLKDIENLKKEFNKNVYNYELQEIKKINELKNSLVIKIKQNTQNEIEEFVKSVAYKKFLENNIKQTLDRIDKEAECIVYVTENDFSKFGSKLVSKYKNATLDKISNSYIGGCIVLDVKNKISLDNTLKNSINEQIAKINF